MTEPSFERPPLDAARLAALAPTWRVEVLPEVDSTNRIVAERAASGEPEGLVVTTEHQYAGRGRLDRGWSMPPRVAIAMSVLLRPALPPQRWPWIPLATGLAVAIAAHPAARVKWPNDVLLGERKICGILVERIGEAAVIGIGLNVSLTAEELPVPTATSLLLETGQEPDRAQLIADILSELMSARWLLENDPGLIREEYEELSATIGQEVRVELPSGEVLEGTAGGIEDDGRLVVLTATGAHAVAAGDVVHARLA